MLNRLIQALEWKKVRMVIQYAVYMLLVMLLHIVGRQDILNVMEAPL